MPGCAHVRRAARPAELRARRRARAERGALAREVATAPVRRRICCSYVRFTRTAAERRRPPRPPVAAALVEHGRLPPTAAYAYTPRRRARTRTARRGGGAQAVAVTSRRRGRTAFETGGRGCVWYCDQRGRAPSDAPSSRPAGSASDRRHVDVAAARQHEARLVDVVVARKSSGPGSVLQRERRENAPPNVLRPRRRPRTCRPAGPRALMSGRRGTLAERARKAPTRRRTA